MTGWVCLSIIAFNYIGTYAVTYAAILGNLPPPPPPASLSDIWPVLIGMLGMGGLRTYEKATGVASDNLDGE